VVDKNANNSFVFQKKLIGEALSKEEAESAAKKLSTPELHYLTSFPFEN
jgi:lipopolysaccharide export system ATP-binding protein